MRLLPLFACFVIAAPAAAQDQSPPPPAPPATPTPAEAKPLYHFPGLAAPTTGPARHSAGPRSQLFVAPSGEPFRAPFGQPYPVATWFAQADTNHDGKLDLREFEDDFERFFKVLDQDHNGIIEGTEITHYEHDLLPETSGGGGGGFGGFSGLHPGGGEHRGGRSGGHGHRGGGGPGGGGGLGGGYGGGGNPLGLAGAGGGKGSGGAYGGQDEESAPPEQKALPNGSFAEPISGAGRFGLINIPEPLLSMDANLDGTVTLNEALDAARRRFDLLDPDHRGYLTLDELPLTAAQRGGGRR